ncbi:ABC transporter permease [Microlunatus sp. GCM10028923]|uniref:ABC transporter permease n=1 Tax=Microlunatus sp. GCM10028923 TaxID=3273400 RepID=UPI00360737C2
MLRRFLSITKVRVGLAIFVAMFAVGFIGPWLMMDVLGMDPLIVDTTRLAAPPSPEHWLGTTASGQDVLLRIVLGTRGSLLVGLTSALIATGIALIVGITAGYLGGAVDAVINAVINVFLTMPSFVVLLMIAAAFRDLNWVMVSVIIGVFEWPGTARSIRAQAMSLRGRDFTAALRTIGERPWRIVLVELAPHLNGLASSLFLSAFVAGIFAQSGMAFLGIGNASEYSWGTEINLASGQNALFRGLWWWFLPPGLAIALLGFATALINFGLDEVTNPALSSKRAAIVRRFLAERRKRRASRPNTLEVTG